jgi:hypothetical protein
LINQQRCQTARRIDTALTAEETSNRLEIEIEDFNVAAYYFYRPWTELHASRGNPIEYKEDSHGLSTGQKLAKRLWKRVS